MADVRAKYPEVPRCEESTSGYRYRAIETQWEGLSSFDLIPENMPLMDDLAHNPFLRDLPQYERFGDSDICKLPDPADPKKDALYLTFQKPLGHGGRDGPYPFQVPMCSRIQPVRRLLKVADGEKGRRPAAANPSSLPAATDIEPSPEELERIQNYFGISQAGIGLCQSQISSFPASYGLFIGRYDPLADFAQKPQKPGVEWAVTAMAGLRESLPRHMQSCMPSDAENRDFLSRFENMTRMQIPDNNAFVGKEVSTIAAPKIASRIQGVLTRLDISDENAQTIEEVVAFGLRHGLPEEEFLPLARELVKIDRNPEEFIYAFTTIVVLHVAKFYHEKYIQVGGIAADFEDFAKTIASAITDGQIGIKIKNMADMLLFPGAFAYYDSVSNQLTFPPIQDGFALAPINLSTFVHECYHAYQDIGRRKLTTVEAERQAHTINQKMSAFITLNSPISYDEAFKDAIQQEDETISAYVQKIQSRSPLCQSLPASVQEEREAVISDSMETMQKWSLRLFATGPNAENYSRFLVK